MTDINDIPADVNILMTEDLSRAFNLCGCEPECHCCGDSIEIGMIFKLAYIKSYGEFSVTYHTGEKYKNISEEDEMLCDRCTDHDLIAYKKALWEQRSGAFDNRHSGYTRKHENNL